MKKNIPKPAESYEKYYCRLINYIFIISFIVGSLLGYIVIHNLIVGALLGVSISVLIPSFIELFKYFTGTNKNWKNYR